MNTKLTLSIDKTIISRAKTYARQKNKSLSRIVQDYLKSISEMETNEIIMDSMPPVTSALSGVLKGRKEIDIRAEISGYLLKKYK